MSMQHGFSGTAAADGTGDETNLGRWFRFTFACLACVLPLASVLLRAEESVPDDTNLIESLTPEQARTLAEQFPGVPLEYQTAEGHRQTALGLPLRGLKSLDPAVAEELAGYAKGPLLLDGLTTLSDDAAKALARHNAWFLILDGLTTLSPAAAQALASRAGKEDTIVSNLSLRGLTTLSPAVAQALASRAGDLSLSGLTTLSDETAEALARHKGSLSLDGLTTLSPAAAQALASCDSKVSLRGLTTLSDETAEALARHSSQKRVLRLDGLTTLSDTGAEILARHTSSGLSLDGLTALSDAAARALARKKRGSLSLNGLTTLSAAAAQALAQHTGSLYLDGLTTLSDEAAEALAQRAGNLLSLNGLTTLSDKAIRALAASKVHGLCINRLTALPADAVQTLLQRPGRTEFLGGLTRLDVETARVLAAADKWDGRLPSLTALDSADSVAIAAVLAARKGPLSLPKLTKISAQTLSALFGNPDVTIPADRQTDVPANPPRVIAARVLLPGRGAVVLQRQDGVFLGGLVSLDVETARVLAAADKWDGRLPSLTAFDSADSVAIATALAARKGPLSLPNLAKISPRTLSALIAKQDVEIPLVATLEFIAEPDGGPTEDFMIPDWLAEREKLRGADRTRALQPDRR